MFHKTFLSIPRSFKYLRQFSTRSITYSERKLEGKVAFVTGAGGGIGRAISLSFAKQGAIVAVSDIVEKTANETVAEIKKIGGEAMTVVTDVCDEQQVNESVARVVEKYKKLDVMVCNAGIQHICAVDQLKFEDWRRVLSVHLDAAFLCTRAALQQMYKRENNGGSIIYIGSVHSKEASVLKAPYVAAKHGILGLARTVAKEGAEKNVRTNVICPGFVYTQLVAKQIPEQAQSLGISEEDVVKKIMLKNTIDGEFTRLEDVADAAVFFASQTTNAFSGQSIIVSHGWHMQ